MAASMDECVSIEETNRFGVCTICVPQKRNPISAPVRSALMAAMESLRAKEHIRSVVITGSGSSFCSGMDLQDLAHCIEQSHEQQQSDAKSIADFFHYIHTYPKPTIAAVNGPAVAGGCGLVLACDLAIASDTATFCFSESKIGFVPAIVGVYLVRAIGSKAARDLLFTARKVQAPEAKMLGLINEVVNATELRSRADFWADQIWHNSPASLRMTKDLLIQAENLTIREALDVAVEYNVRGRRQEECAEGVQAFLAKRLPSWQMEPNVHKK